MEQPRHRRHSAPSGETGLSIPLHDLGLKIWQWVITRDASDTPGVCAIAHLPVEVLQAIFAHYLDRAWADASIQKGGWIRVAQVPCTLGGVCFHWRQVTLSMPLLWSQLWITAPHGDDAHFLELWFQRLGLHHPLHLHLEDNPFAGPSFSSSPFCAGLLHSATTHSSQWRHIQLHLWQAEEYYLRIVAPLDLPLLESLSIRASRSWTSSHIYRSLYAAPKLTAIQFHGPHLDSIEMAEAPWEQITTAGFESYVSWDVLVSILARAHSLRHLSINQVAFDGISDVNKGSIVVAALRSLTLGPHLLRPAEFFDALMLPSLVEIGLNRTFGYQFHEGYAAVAALVHRSRCQLRSFVWFEPSGNVGLPPEDFVLHSFLAPRPMFLAHLITLKIASPVRDVHLKALTHRRALPHLEDIFLEQCWSTDGVLSDMILSRATKLKSVSAVLYGSGIIVNPRFTRDLSLRILSVHLDIRKG